MRWREVGSRSASTPLARGTAPGIPPPEETVVNAGRRRRGSLARAVNAALLGSSRSSERAFGLVVSAFPWPPPPCIHGTSLDGIHGWRLRPLFAVASRVKKWVVSGWWVLSRPTPGQRSIRSLGLPCWESGCVAQFVQPITTFSSTSCCFEAQVRTISGLRHRPPFTKRVQKIKAPALPQLPAPHHHTITKNTLAFPITNTAIIAAFESQ